MSFIFSAVNGSHIGQADQPIPAGTFYGTAFGQGVHDMMLSSIYRMSEYDGAQEYDEETNPMVRQAEANHYAQQEGLDFKFQTDVTMDEMNLLLRRHTEKRDRDMILQQGSTDGWRIAGSMGVQFIASQLNPLDMALNFIPIVGTGAKGKAAAEIGMIGRAFQRGLISEEALAARGLALKGYTASVVEGAVGNAISEIPLMLSNRQDQTGYTGDQFAMAVGLGAVFGGVINTGRLALKRAFKTHERLSPEAKENMSAAAMEDFVQGRTIDPGRVALLDDSVHTAQIQRGGLTGVAREPEVQIVYHGGNPEIKDFELPLFTSPDLALSKSFASVRDGGQIYQLEIKTEHTLDLTKQESIEEVIIPLLDELGVKYEYDSKLPDDLTGKPYSFEITGNDGQFIPEFLVDLGYDPKITQALVARGYDSIYDDLGGDKVLSVIKDPKQISIIDSKKASNELTEADFTKHQAATYKAHEEAKQAKSEADREKEIADGNTLDAPDDHHFGSVVDDAELKRIDDEIAQLEADLVATNPLELQSARDAQMRLGETIVVRTPTGSKPIKVASSQDLWYFGGDRSVQEFRLPVFLTTDKSGAEWYAGERTIEGQGVVHSVEVSAKKPLYLDSEKAFVKEWIPLLNEAGIEFNYTPSTKTSGWEVTIPEIKNHSQYDGTNILDVAYIDRFREVATKHGYDSLEGFDVLENGEIPVKVLIKSPEQASIKSSETYTDGIPDISPEEAARQQAATYSAQLFREIRGMLPPPRNQSSRSHLLPDKPEYTVWDVAYAAIERYPETKAILDELFKLDPDMRNLKVTFDYDLSIENNARGMYYADADELSLDPQFASINTLVHEITHAQTARRIREDMDKLGEIGALSLMGDRYFNRIQRYAALTENKGIREIIEAYTKAVKFLAPETRAMLNIQGFSIHAGVHKGFANLDEFIAEGLTDTGFQNILNSLPSGKKSVLNSLFDAVKKILGVDVKEDSLLAQLLDGYKKMVDEGGTRDSAEFLKNLPKTKVISKQLLEKASTCIL